MIVLLCANANKHERDAERHGTKQERRNGESSPASHAEMYTSATKATLKQSGTQTESKRGEERRSEAKGEKAYEGLWGTRRIPH